MTDCVTSEDPEPMGVALEVALAAEDCTGLAALVSYWRARASRAEGRCEGMQEAIAYLRARVATLEQREAISEWGDPT